MTKILAAIAIAFGMLVSGGGTGTAYACDYVPGVGCD